MWRRGRRGGGEEGEEGWEIEVGWVRTSGRSSTKPQHATKQYPGCDFKDGRGNL